jgi:hypothetical protein
MNPNEQAAHEQPVFLLIDIGSTYNLSKKTHKKLKL